MLCAASMDKTPTQGWQITGAFRVDIARIGFYAGAYDQRYHSCQSRPIHTLPGDAMGGHDRCSENRVPSIYATRFGRAAFLSGRSAHHYLGVRKSNIAMAQTA